MAASLFSSSIGSLSNDDGDGNENDKKAIAKQQLCTCITLFCTFLSRRCTTTTWKCLISRFVEDGNTRQQLSFSFPELWYSLLEFNSRKICQHLTKWTRWNKRDKVWSSATSLFKWRFRSRRRRCSLSFLLLLVKTYALKSPASCSFPCSQDMRQLNNLLCYKQD